MNEEIFRKVLYLIFKVLIKNSGYLSQLEIFKYVRALLSKSFQLNENDLVFKIGQGKSEDFKEILNFTLTILCELDLVSEKMENKSFFFKWNSFKGFFNKFSELLKEQKEYEISESIEHRAQLYTRYLILFLIRHEETGITSKDIEDIMLHCGLEGQYKDLEKIHFILCFIGFINKEDNHNGGSVNANANQIFTLIKETAVMMPFSMTQVCFKVNPCIFKPELHSDLDQSSIEFNKSILAKGMELNEKVDVSDMGYNPMTIPINMAMMMSNSKVGNTSGIGNNVAAYNNTMGLGLGGLGLGLNTKDTVIGANANEVGNGTDMGNSDMTQSDLLKYQVTIDSFNKDKEEEGFAMLKGVNWVYYIRKLYCIIGRSPLKNFLSQPQGNMQQQPNANTGNTTWEIDVDLGQSKRISKQHALIAYNFHTGSFEIKNLSKKFYIKVNGEFLKYNEEMILTSKSVIHISNQEFYFLLPN